MLNKLFPRHLRMILPLMLLLAAVSQSAYAHQQPTTLGVLDVGPNKVAMTLHVPLSELELAFGHDVTQSPETSLGSWQVPFRAYLLAHIHPVTDQSRPWSVAVEAMNVEQVEQTQSGPYQEITAHLILTPPAGESTRRFTLNYDVIMHQVVSHKAIISVHNDWEAGRTEA